MSSTILQPVADLVAALIESLDVDPLIKGYSIDPGPVGLDSLPAGVCGLPKIQRTDADGGESQLGTYDWTIELPVMFLFDLYDTTTAQAQALQTVEAFIKAVDTGSLSTSDPQIVDAKVTSSDPGELIDEARPMLSYDCRLQILRYTT